MDFSPFPLSKEESKKMALYYLPLQQNPKAYVWDDVESVLYSTIYGQRYNCPNGLYRLKQGKDSFNRMGYKVSMYFRGPRRFLTIDELHAMVNTAKIMKKEIPFGNSLSANDDSEMLPEKRFLVIGCNPEFVTREEAIERIRKNAVAVHRPTTRVIVEIKSAEQVTAQLQPVIIDTESIEL